MGNDANANGHTRSQEMQRDDSGAKERRRENERENDNDRGGREGSLGIDGSIAIY